MIHILSYTADFFAGAFLCYCLPLVLCGLQGLPFPSPFAKPRGVGDSSPLVNFLWGASNLFIGICLLAWHPVAVGFRPDFGALVIGFLALGVPLSHHFGKIREGRFKR